MVEVNEFCGLIWMQVWQVSLMIAAVLLVTRFTTRNRPHLAFVLWFVVLIKCVTPPVFSSPVSLFSQLQQKTVIVDGDLRDDSRLRSYAQTEALTIRKRLNSIQEPENPFLALGSQRFGGEQNAGKTADGLSDKAVQNRGLISFGWLNTFNLCSLWLITALAGLIILRVRVSVTMKQIRHSAEPTPTAVAQLLTSLKGKLGIRGPVNLIVSTSRFGPSVVGVFRPTIVLPNKLIELLSNNELSAILAHELVHIRRRDLWVGMFQATVQSLWWFNPLVWMANNRLNLEVERCCDEEVIARLGIKPADYARGLVSVLENMRLVKPVFASPGVRPIELTSDRLERIMVLGNGCRKRIPLSYVAVALFVSAVALPGAASVMAVQQEGMRLPPAEESTALIEDPIEVPNGGIDEDTLFSSLDHPIIKAYALSGLISEIQAAHGLSGDESRKVVESRIRSSVVPWEMHRQRRRVAGLGLPNAGDEKADVANYRWDVRKNTLLVVTSANHHQQVEAAIDDFSVGLESYVINATVISCDEFTLNKLSPNWVAGQELIEVVDPKRRDSLQEIFRESQRRGDATVITAPRLATALGTICSIQCGSERPFVVEVDKATGQPVIELVQDGIYIQCRLEKQDGDLSLRYEVVLSVIDSVETTLETAAGRQHTIQLPMLSVNKSQDICVIQSGDGVLVGGHEDISESKLNKRFLCYFEIERIDAGPLAKREPSESTDKAEPSAKADDVQEAGSPLMAPLKFQGSANQRTPLLSKNRSGAKSAPEQMPKAPVDPDKAPIEGVELATREFDLSFWTQMDDATKQAFFQSQASTAYLNHLRSLSPKRRLEHAFESVAGDLDAQIQWSNNESAGPSYRAVGLHRVTVTDTENRIDQIQLAIYSQRFEMSIQNHIELEVYRVKARALETVLRDSIDVDGIEIDSATRDYLTKTFVSEANGSLVRHHELTLVSEFERGFSLDALFKLKPKAARSFVNFSMAWDGPDTNANRMWLSLQDDERTIRKLADGVAVPTAAATLLDLTDPLIAEGYDFGEDRILLIAKCKTEYDQDLYRVAKALEDKLRPAREIYNYTQEALFPN